MASLLAIPTELLVSISGRLSTQDLGSFRLSCKHVEHGVFDWFQKEFFTKKQFFLSYPSLKALLDISNHSTFQKTLKHVIIATDVYHLGTSPSIFRDQDAAERYYQGAKDQSTLLNSGMDRKLLAEAFANLQDLETVGIRDFNASNRSRDNGSWSSWGAPTVSRETGIQLSFGDAPAHGNGIRGRYHKHVFVTVLHALSEACRTPAQIEVLLRHERLKDDAFHIPDFLEPFTAPVLQNLTALLLNVDLRAEHALYTYIPLNEPAAATSLRHFLSLTPNLQHLRLNLDPSGRDQNDSFFKWLGQTTVKISFSTHSRTIPRPITFHALRTLELGNCQIDPQVLLPIISKYAARLESLSLWKIGLVYWDSTNKTNVWAELFRSIASIPHLQLKTIKAGMLKQDFMHVGFGTDEDPTTRHTPSIEYTGKSNDVITYLEKLAERVVVNWPPPPISDSDEEMDSEQDEDEEHDDEEDDEEEGEDE